MRLDIAAVKIGFLPGSLNRSLNDDSIFSQSPAVPGAVRASSMGDQNETDKFGLVEVVSGSSVT